MPPVLTLFACPKPFTDPHIAMIQRNAILSWTALRPQPTIILFGDEEGVAESSREFGLVHVPVVERNARGTPLLSDIFKKAEMLTRAGTLCYANADIILLDDFTRAAQECMALEKAIMIGARTDLDVTAPITLNDPEWRCKIRSEALERGTPMAVSSDYFVFKRGFYNALPPFLVGRPAYDNWMIWYARSNGVIVVDASHAVLAIHQNHGQTQSWVNTQDQTENETNRSLAGFWRATYGLRDANAFLSLEGIRSRRLSAITERFRIAGILMRGNVRRLVTYARASVASFTEEI